LGATVRGARSMMVIWSSGGWEFYALALGRGVAMCVFSRENSPKVLGLG
jgi:hypothetical protein